MSDADTVVPATAPATDAPLHVVVITGMSGAGRRAAAHTLEDLGWYLVDNLPPSMLPRLLDNCAARAIDRVVVILDVRTLSEFKEIPAAFGRLAAEGVHPRLLFLDASDEVIVRRQAHVRRPHPLQGDGPLLDGVRREREMLSDLRALADVVIDTDRLHVHQLAERVAHAFGAADGADGEIQFTLMSFGFKNGIPVDADLVFDVRFLPNPHWDPALRPMSGLDAPVRDFVLAQEGAQAYLAAMTQVVVTAAPGYVREGKRHATIGIGCTGGKHRSTAMTNALAARLREHGYECFTLHRDLGLE